jgi:glycosyltransferase involved in cell wall biosynthesis
MPRVSLIMTVRNGERYLENALSSLLSQSYSDIEIIVVNNGSMDSTAEILARLHDPRLKIISVDPILNSTFASGISRAFNAADGEFVAVQDSDDFSDNSRIEKQVGYLDAHPRVGLVGSRFECISELDEHLFFSNQIPQSAKLMQLYAEGNQLVHSTIMFRRKIATEFNGYNTDYEYACDYRLALDILCAGHLVSGINETLIKVRRHSDQETARRDTATIRSQNSLSLLKYAQKLTFLSKTSLRKGRRQIIKSKFQLILNLIHDGKKLDALTLFRKTALKSPLYILIYALVRAIRGQLGDAPRP